ncbi:MAG: hypothetical protein QM724_11245 [Flavobacteriales bacterium]
MTDMNTGAVKPARPTLLTVICILSLLFAAYSLITGIIGSLHGTSDEDHVLVEQKMAEAQDQLAGNPGMEEMMESMRVGTMNSLDNARSINLGGAISAVLSLIGVWMMWNLRKVGFWIYLLATLLGLAVPLHYIGTNVVGFGYVGFFGFISLIFIILYAVNLKHMR